MGKEKQILIFVILALSSYVSGQDGGDCKVDTDCGEADPCCSRFGFCGEDAGYCYPIEGCLLRGVEIDGGDLTSAEGGGGVNVERGQIDGCAFICEENSQCGWYTYDKSSNQCFLKGTRGFLSNGTQTGTIISGSTQSGGCVFNPREEGQPNRETTNRRRPRQRCRYPYRRYGNRCLHYCQMNRRMGINNANNRRNYNYAKLLCNNFQSNLPYSFDGSAPNEDFGDDWHWLNFPPKQNQCLAVRPARFEEGAAYFPCEYKFNFACEKMSGNNEESETTIEEDQISGNEREREPKAAFPEIQKVANISQYNYEYQRCSQGLSNCQGGSRWLPNYSSNTYGGCGLNSCDRGLSGYNPFNNARGNNFNTNGCNSCSNGYNGNRGVINRGQSGGCNECGGGGNGFNYNDYSDYNYGNNNRDYGNYDYDYGNRNNGGRGFVNVGVGSDRGGSGSGGRR